MKQKSERNGVEWKQQEGDPNLSAVRVIFRLLVSGIAGVSKPREVLARGRKGCFCPPDGKCYSGR